MAAEEEGAVTVIIMISVALDVIGHIGIEVLIGTTITDQIAITDPDSPGFIDINILVQTFPSYK
jgi:hypothetical protein